MERKLLEALSESLKEATSIPGARTMHFAFADDGTSAYLSEIIEGEMIPLLEDWCRRRREEIPVWPRSETVQ